ncbi:MAG: zf-HC2 domain-containing protein [Deltaproteobacteria bacterium]|nr:zf-HC2 domain-containing protein [Deltaproteobacteria bacterium]
MKWQCALLQRWLPEYPEGDLPAFWKGRLKAHLDRCPACRAEQAALREVVEAIASAPKGDPGPEFWTDFSREMHLKLVRAAQAGQMAPARSVWWGRIPYLVGAPALAALLLWVAVGYLNPERPGLTPPPQVAKSAAPAVTAPPAAIAKQESATPARKLAAAPQAPAELGESQNFVNVARNSGDEAFPEEDLDDLDSTLAGMTTQEREAFLKKLSQHEKDGSCLTRYSAISSA